MNAYEKINQIKRDVISVGLHYGHNQFIEIVTEDIDLIPKEILSLTINKIKHFETPTYIEMYLS